MSLKIFRFFDYSCAKLQVGVEIRFSAITHAQVVKVSPFTAVLKTQEIYSCSGVFHTDRCSPWHQVQASPATSRAQVRVGVPRAAPSCGVTLARPLDGDAMYDACGAGTFGLLRPLESTVTPGSSEDLGDGFGEM